MRRTNRQPHTSAWMSLTHTILCQRNQEYNRTCVESLLYKVQNGQNESMLLEVKVAVILEGWGETGTRGAFWKLLDLSGMIQVYSLCKYCAFGKISLSYAPMRCVIFCMSSTSTENVWNASECRSQGALLIIVICDNSPCGLEPWSPTNFGSLFTRRQREVFQDALTQV